MKYRFSNTTKIAVTAGCFVLAVIGFMIKLPSVFRHMDKELHALFYFLAAAFCNILFNNKKIAIHILIFIALFLFGAFIEYAQAYSNKLFHTRIHGRFDPEDLWFNTKGLIAYSVLWVLYVLGTFLFGKKGAGSQENTGT
jgi:small-conductance mechanosensitive channel